MQTTLFKPKEKTQKLFKSKLHISTFIKFVNAEGPIQEEDQCLIK